MAKPTTRTGQSENEPMTGKVDETADTPAESKEIFSLKEQAILDLAKGSIEFFLTDGRTLTVESGLPRYLAAELTRDDSIETNINNILLCVLTLKNIGKLLPIPDELTPGGVPPWLQLHLDRGNPENDDLFERQLRKELLSDDPNVVPFVEGGAPDIDPQELPDDIQQNEIDTLTQRYKRTLELQARAESLDLNAIKASIPKWKGKKKEELNIVEFINKVYADYLDGFSFGRTELGYVDPKALQALIDHERPLAASVPLSELNLPKNDDKTEFLTAAVSPRHKQAVLSEDRTRRKKKGRELQ